MQLNHLMSKKRSFFFKNILELHSSTCCVCRCHLDKGSSVVSSDDRNFVFLTRNTWIPEGARCCPEHIVDRRLTKEALDSIKPSSIRYQEWSSSQIETLLGNFRDLYNGRKRFNFDDCCDLSDYAYSILTSLSKDNFDNLVEVVSSSSNARNSSHRSIRTAVKSISANFVLVCRIACCRLCSTCQTKGLSLESSTVLVRRCQNVLHHTIWVLIISQGEKLATIIQQRLLDN